MKKTWQQPHLMVLTKGHQEEVVLVVCKYWDPPLHGPDSQFSATCYSSVNPCSTQCSSQAVS